MGLTVEVVVVVVVVTMPTRVMVSLAVTVSRATEGTTRALTATLAPTTREDMVAMVNPSQVDFLALHNHAVSYGKMAKVFSCLLFTLSLGGYESPSSNQGGGGYSHSSQPYSSGGYNNNNQSSNMSYNQQSSFSGYSQQPPPLSPSG